MVHYYNDILEPLINGPVDDLVEFLRCKGVLKRVVKCLVCLEDMKTKPYTRNRDKLAFRCYTKDCKGYLKYHSVRTESVLDGYSVPLGSILKICWKWYTDQTQVQMAKEVDMSQRTIVKIVDNLRELCVKFYRDQPIQLGGDGCVVEADESLFRHNQKYHRGRQPAGELWVFG